jgi:hypothetical protein
MTFKNMQDEIIDLRFNETNRTRVKRWLNATEAKVWSAFEWPFKFVEAASLPIGSGDYTPDMTMLPGFFRVARGGFQDDLGNVLRYMAPDDFDENYRGTMNVESGRPRDFTVRNAQIYLGPTPDADYTYTISYERDLVHFNTNGDLIGGEMTADSDYPVWGSSFHYLLVPGAMELGLVMVNDPTAMAVGAEFGAELLRMADHYLPPDIPETQQYGADRLGYEFC